MPVGKYIRSEEYLAKLRARLKNNPPMKGRHHSEDTKIKQSQTQIGKHTISEETRGKLRKSHQGQKAWNKGIPLSEEQKRKLRTYHVGIPLSEETKKKLSIARIGNKNRLGKKLSDKEKEHLSQIMKGNKLNLGRIPSKETRQKMSEQRSGEKHWNWLGGKSYEPYTKEFNRQLKELIRDRDNHECQMCGMMESLLPYKLNVHHINYEKKDIMPQNLVSLCKNCHTKTNNRREYWKGYLGALVAQKMQKYSDKVEG